MLFAGFGGAMLIACSTESVDEQMDSLNATGTSEDQPLADDISGNELVGTWNMFSMTSEFTTVDFDQDGNRTTDLLLETDCFDPMYFIFGAEGDVNTYQSRLFFSATSGEFTCQTTGSYNATYQVNGNELSVTFTVDGYQYTETKTISRYYENGNEFLKVTLTKGETNSAVYVADDPGNTVASDLQEIEMVYLKQ